MTRDDLVEQLHALFGASLRAVVLYGSAARENARPGADQNVLVLVDALDATLLPRLGQTTRAWGEAGNPPPLAFTVDEWLRSADIFPMEYADILASHRVLYGAVPRDGLVVSRADLRLEAERETMSKVLRLRQGMMHAGDDPARQADLLRASHSTVLVLLRAALRVAGESVDGAPREVIRRAAERIGFEPSPLLRTRDFVEERDELTDRETTGLLTGVLAAMLALVAWLDQADVTDATVASPPAPEAPR